MKANLVAEARLIVEEYSQVSLSLNQWDAVA